MEGLLSIYGSSNLDAIEKRRCVFPPNHVALTVASSSGSDGINLFKLQMGNDKVDLKQFAILKPNGKKILMIKAVTVGDAIIDCNVNYLFPSQSRVSPLIDASSMIYHAGYISVRQVSGKFQVEIPVTEHLLLSGVEQNERYGSDY